MLRDCMLAMRIVIIKNKKFFSSKARYRLAWLIQHCATYLKIQRESPKYAVLSGHVVDVLMGIFFNNSDELHTTHVVENHLSNYYANSEEGAVASFNNLNSFMRTKTKLIKLFVSHLATHKKDELASLDRMAKLLEFMIKDEEKRIRAASGNSHSLKAAILHTFQTVFAAMQEKALGAVTGAFSIPAEPAGIEFAFRTAGKLRELLQNRMDVLKYLEVDVDIRLRNLWGRPQTMHAGVSMGGMGGGGVAANPQMQNAAQMAQIMGLGQNSQATMQLLALGQSNLATLQLADEPKMKMMRIQLQTKWCPLNCVLYKAAQAYCEQKKIPLYETTEDLKITMSRWKEAFGDKKNLSLKPKPLPVAMQSSRDKDMEKAAAAKEQTQENGVEHEHSSAAAQSAVATQSAHAAVSAAEAAQGGSALDRAGEAGAGVTASAVASVASVAAPTTLTATGGGGG